MTPRISLIPIGKTERLEFMQMAVNYFRELNPQFKTGADWTETYFENIQRNPNYWLRWIVSDGDRAGFILFGMQDHHFLPRKNGVIWELFIAPQERRKGIARLCAQLAIVELKKFSPAKIQLEIVEGNKAAVEFWKSLGFQKSAERFSMREPLGSSE